MKLKYFIPAFMAVIAMLVGCSTDNDPIYLGEINVSTSYVAIDKEGGSTPVTVKAVGDWAFDTASIPEWLTVSPLSGSAGVNYHILCSCWCWSYSSIKGKMSWCYSGNQCYSGSR